MQILVAYANSDNHFQDVKWLVVLRLKGGVCQGEVLLVYPLWLLTTFQQWAISVIGIQQRKWDFRQII